MSDYQQKIAESFSERKRLNQLRRRKEKLHFWNEFRIIPRWLIGLVIVLYVIAVAVALSVNISQQHNPNGNDMFPPELRDNPALAQLALAGLITPGLAVLRQFHFHARLRQPRRQSPRHEFRPLDHLWCSSSFLLGASSAWSSTS